MTYVLDVFMADTSSLKNRALVFAFANTPYIVTTFIGPRAAQSFLRTSGWPWGFGTFAIITPVIAIPIMAILWINQRRAIREGVLIRRKSGRTFGQSVNFYFWEFDSKSAAYGKYRLCSPPTVIGLILICAGFALVLLPFSLASYQAKGWHSSMIIAFFVVGGICLLVFPLYEKFLAKKSFIPFSLLTDRSVIGACLLAAFLFISF